MITVIPKDKDHWLSLRKGNINSTEVAALFNCSPYMTEYELWHLKKGMIQDSFSENERTKWGSRLQDSIAHGVAEDNNWKIKKMDEYMYDQDHRIGSSFDFMIPLLNKTLQPALLEVKNVDSLAFKNGWIQHDDGDLEAPLHIELQVQHQLFISGLDTAFIAALVGGNTPFIIERQRDESIIKQILKKVSMFWESINKNEPPNPDFEKDFETIKQVYAGVKKGKAIEGTSTIKEWAEKYSRLGEEIGKLNREREVLKGKMLMAMGDAEKILDNTFTVTSGIVNRKSYTVEPAVYRNFIVRHKEQEVNL